MGRWYHMKVANTLRNRPACLKSVLSDSARASVALSEIRQFPTFSTVARRVPFEFDRSLNVRKSANRPRPVENAVKCTKDRNGWSQRGKLDQLLKAAGHRLVSII
jgi:hypothetical protein